MSYSKRLLTQKNLYNLILILILVALLGIGYLSYKEPEEQNSSGEINGIWVNDNSIVAYKIPYIPKIQVLGSFWEELNKYDWDADLMYEIMKCESNFIHNAVGDKDTPYHSYGLLQIRNLPSRNFDTETLFDPVENIRIAYDIWKEQSYLAWLNCYENNKNNLIYSF